MSLNENNLVAIDSAITLKAGQRVVKIGNSLIPVGIGGNFEPGSTVAMKFYKCAPVDTGLATARTTFGGRLAV